MAARVSRIVPSLILPIHAPCSAIPAYVIAACIAPGLSHLKVGFCPVFIFTSVPTTRYCGKHYQTTLLPDPIHISESDQLYTSRSLRHQPAIKMPGSTTSSSSTATSLTKPVTKPVKLPCWCGDDCSCCIIPCTVM